MNKRGEREGYGVASFAREGEERGERLVLQMTDRSGKRKEENALRSLLQLLHFQRYSLFSLLSSLSSFLFIFFLLSCDGTQYEFSSRHSYLVLDNNAHQDPTLASAMTPYSGVFVAITLKNKGGAQYYQFTSNQGQSSESIFNAIDQRRTVLLGMNQGLIVGYSTWSDLTFYAYDRECPNCFNPDVVPIRSKALQMSSTGIATCQSCHRKYDLNSGGIVVDGDKGDKLVRYRAGTTGAYGVLNVN